jgi:hypothetical protein
LYKTASGIILQPKERERKGERKAMKTRLNEKIEFNPQKDLLGKTIERNRTGHGHPAGLKGL